MIISTSMGRRGRGAAEGRREAARDVRGFTEGWLLAAARDEALARSEWLEQGVALLECGARFGAVRLPYGIIHTAAGTKEHGGVCRYLRRSLRGGPVFVQPRGELYYALVSLAATRRWRVPNIEVVSAGTYLGVPSLERVWPYGLDSYWAVPPTLPSRLCGPAALGRLVATGLDAQGYSGEAGND
jgi:hypothetical protein